MIRSRVAAAILSLLMLAAAGPSPAQDPGAEAGHRAEAIRRYEALVQDPSPALAGRKDELMFRLALLYLEEGQAFGPGGGGYYERSISLFDRVLRQKGTVFREDALYYRAIALQEVGRTGPSTAAFRELLREFPASPRAGELWFRIGNDAVQNDRIREAMEAYEEVLRRGDPNYRDQAAYMFAWSASSLGQESRARTTLIDLLQRLEAGGQQQANLYPEAVELLARVIRSEGNPSVLSGPWVGARPAFAGVVLRRVADLFRETSAFAQAASTYEQFLREVPDSPDADAIETTVIDSWLKAGEADRAQAARERLIARHAAGGVLGTSSVAAIAPIVRDSALYRHERARKAGRPDLYRQAIEHYDLYARSVPAGPAHQEARFFEAEAAKEMGDLRGAAERYLAVAESRDPARGEEAAFRRVALFEDLKGAGQASLDDLVGAYHDYFRLYPGSPRDTELRVRLAGLLFDEKRWDDALVAGGEVVGRIGDAEGRQKMLLLLARAAFAKEDYLQGSNWASRLLAEPGLPPARRAEAEKIHVAALYKGAESMQDRPADAAGQYELLASRYPKHESAPAALYNAAVLLRDAGEKARALTLFRRLIDQYPDAGLHRDATAAATQIYKEQGDAAGAVALLEQAASRAGGGGETADFLYQAALEAERAGSHVRTMDLFRKFLRAWPPNDFRAARARMAVARAHAALGQHDEAERVARQTIERLPAGASGDEAQQLQAIAAEARSIVADAELRRFEAVRLVEPVARNLERKQAALEAALTELRRAAAFGFSDISLASHTKIGYAQLDFANSIMQAPRPKNLSPDEMARYEALLLEQVAPWRTAAADAFRIVVEQGARAGIDNEWTARARAGLQQLENVPSTPAAAATGSGPVAPPPPVASDVPILPGN